LAVAITGLGLQTMSDYNRIIDNYRRASDNMVRAERLNRYMEQAALDGHGLYNADSARAEQWAAYRVDATADKLAAFVDDWNARLLPGELPDFPAVRDFVLGMARDGHALAKIAREQGLAAANAYGNHPQNRATRENMQARIDSMVAKITTREADSRIALTRFEKVRAMQFLAVAGIGILLLLAASLWIAVRSIAEPLGAVRRSMVRISEGQYETPIPVGHKDGEIAELWGALDILKAHAIEAERLSRERLEAEHRMRELVLD
jgi:methyl-accepting chemotaxis protein